MKANAAVAVEARRVEFLEVDVPDPSDEDIVINTERSWISNGTEGSFIRGERIAGDTPRSKSDPLPFPHVPGYQKTGIVTWCGAKVEGFSPGDRVFATVSKVEGMFYSSGGHISPAVTHYSQVWRLPDSVSMNEASGLVLTQVGYNVGIRPPVKSGETVIVIGDGMVGHWAAQTFQSRGARVVIIGKHDERLALFDRNEGDLVVNLSREKDFVRSGILSNGSVVAVADTVGSIETMESLYPLLRREAHLISAGFYGENGKIDIQKMRDRELTLQAPSGWTGARMRSTLDLLRRKLLKTEHLITHRYPAERATEAFDLVLSRSEPVLGVVLEWT